MKIELDAINSSSLSKSEKDRLIDILNSDMDSPMKRIAIMRGLDSDKTITSKVHIIQKDNITKLEKVRQLIYSFRETYHTDIMTRINIMNDMLDELGADYFANELDENGNIKKIIDCSSGSGTFLFLIIERFMNGLVKIKNENDRFKFIIENMIYYTSSNPTKTFNWMCIIDLLCEYKLNIFYGDYLIDKFDDYLDDNNIDNFNLSIHLHPNEEAQIKSSYSDVVLRSINISDKMLFLTPSAWFLGGRGLGDMKDALICENNTKIIKHYRSADRIFNVDINITGDMSYFLYDNKYNGDCMFNDYRMKLDDYDIILTESTHKSLIDRITKSSKHYLNIIFRTHGIFGIGTNDKNLLDAPSKNTILCHVSSNRGKVKYINRRHINNFYLSKKYKVLTSETERTKKGFGRMFIGNPNEVSSYSFIFFTTNTLLEAQSLESYLKTKFANVLLSVRKVTQHISHNTVKWIPLVPLDRIWTDEQLFDYFNLSQDEINLINKYEN